MQNAASNDSTEVPETIRRRLATFDAMVMIAVTAAGFAWTRSYVFDYLFPVIAMRGALPQRYQLVWVLAAVPMLTAWSMGLFLCQMRQPRPPFPAMFTRPGAVACALATLALASEVFWVLVVRVISVSVPGWRDHYGVVRPVSVSYLIAWKQTEAGLAVAGAWLLMAIGRSWQSEPSWLDRAGTGLGVIWIVLYLFESGYLYSMMM
jgi:hypothetical protein